MCDVVEGLYHQWDYVHFTYNADDDANFIKYYNRQAHFIFVRLLWAALYLEFNIYETVWTVAASQQSQNKHMKNIFSQKAFEMRLDFSLWHRFRVGNIDFILAI